MDRGMKQDMNEATAFRTEQERAFRERVLRIHEANPDLSAGTIANRLGCYPDKVRRVLREGSEYPPNVQRERPGR